MRLFTSSATPFGRKVQITLLEKKLPFTIELDDIRLPNPKIAPLNPLRKIPVLQLDDSAILFDSNVICEYLDTKYPNPQLIPSELDARTNMRTLDTVAQGILDASVLIVLEARFHDEQQISQKWIAHQEQKITQGFEFLAKALGQHQYINHTAFSLADITLGCALGYVSFRMPQINWQDKHANLAHYYAQLMQRESFASSEPKVY